METVWWVQQEKIWIFLEFLPFIKFASPYYANHTEGRICLLHPLEEENQQSTITTRLGAMIIMASYNTYYSMKANQYLAGFCPKKTMSCIGKYRRNLLTLQDTSNLIYYWTVYAFFESALIIAPKLFKSYLISPAMVFWAHNVLVISFVDIYHGIVLPCKMVIPWTYQKKKQDFSNFYVRKPKLLDPRRTYVPKISKFPEMPPMSPRLPPLLTRQPPISSRQPPISPKQPPISAHHPLFSPGPLTFPSRLSTLSPTSPQLSAQSSPFSPRLPKLSPIPPTLSPRPFALLSTPLPLSAPHPLFPPRSATYSLRPSTISTSPQHPPLYNSEAARKRLKAGGVTMWRQDISSPGNPESSITLYCRNFKYWVLPCIIK